MSQRLLEVINLKKSYGKKPIIRGINIEVNSKEIVGLLGPNGAGKTTTFHMICGLIKSNEGEIILKDKNISHLPMYKRSRLGLSYLSQEASIFRNLSVENNLLAILEALEPNKKRRLERKEEMLKKFHLQKLAHQLALTLSGGERRRLEIARLLLLKPTVLMLDEPFSGIDPLAIRDIKEIILELREEGLGILITDHNIRETFNIVDRSYIVFDGKILAHGKVEELLKNKDIQKVYVGHNFNL